MITCDDGRFETAEAGTTTGLDQVVGTVTAQVENGGVNV
jgi:hypothetical protein